MAENQNLNPIRDWEALLASVVRRLVKLDKPEAALALAESSVVRMRGWDKWSRISVHLEVPGDHFDEITRPDIYANDEDVNRFGDQYEVEGTSVLCTAFTAAMPALTVCVEVLARIRNEEVSEGWREDFKAAMGRGAVNQGNVPGVPEAPFQSSDGLRYRSKTEMKVASELKRRQLLFLPLPVAVVGGRAIREPDFVVLHKARLGVLEIHGEPWHPASRAAQDHAKSLPYRLAGAEVLIVDSQLAYNTPGVVVDQLLALLERPA